MKEVTSSFVANEVESTVRAFWTTEDIYRQVKEQKKKGKTFFYVDGPPYTTGHIHLGTAWNKILKDSILRYHRMRGCNVIDRAGYDMHGLPIEVRVESELGFKNKKDIETFGIAAFIEKCKDFALTHKDIMSSQFKNLGVWMDFDDPYQTINPNYIEAAWWVLKKAEEKSLLEKGFRVVNWCPRCETAIADSEVEYWDEEDPSIYVKFPITGKDNEYLVIWTTTPWTLPANMGVAVDASFSYARVRAEKDKTEEILWIAENLVEDVLKKGRYSDYTVLSTCTGADLAGTGYSSPLSHMVPHQAEVSHRVVTADFVEMDNTGMVHIAPGHGWDDFLLGQKEGLEAFCPVEGDGLFNEMAGSFAGMFVRDANDAVIDALSHHLLAKKKIVHRYGHCWRCKNPIIYRATEQWFLAIPKIKEQMLTEIRETKWYPDWAGSARFYDFVQGARDWCISRQRYWGIPIPVWQCAACGERIVFGTMAELNERAGTNLSDPHRPYVDEISFPCTCGETMHRVSDIFDVWFDSAMASWATLGFPREKEAFEKMWPADFITEGQDQTRGWFYSQLGASTIAFNRSPYKQVLMHGFALDHEGRKMSKSLGNVVSPEEVIEKFGVDVLRLYILSSNAPWEDLKFNWENVLTVSRSINILWNVYRFPLPYMIMDDFVPAGAEDEKWDETYIIRSVREMPVEDRWILSRINTLARQVTADLQEYQMHKVTRGILNFILEDLSRWYVQIVRPRMWLEDDAPEKQYAYETMYYCQRILNRLLAPFTPHLAEAMYQNVRLRNDPVSIHMQPWIEGNARLIDSELEQKMDVVRAFDEAVSNARQAGKRKLRWPVREVIVLCQTDLTEKAIIELNALCCSRANARIITVIRGCWDRISCTAAPVMKVIGPGFGRNGPLVKKLIESADGPALRKILTKEGEATLTEGDSSFVITTEHVQFEDLLPSGFYGADMPDAMVYVDVELTPDIEAEGYTREIIRRLQDMRKQLDLNVEDYITVDAVISESRVYNLIDKTWQEFISQEVRAKEMVIHSMHTQRQVEQLWQLDRDWNIEGVSITLGISVI